MKVRANVRESKPAHPLACSRLQQYSSHKRMSRYDLWPSTPNPRIPHPSIQTAPCRAPRLAPCRAVVRINVGFYRAIDFSTSSIGEGLLNGGAAGADAAKKAGRGSPPPQMMSMCGLLSLQFYQPYFDVDTSEVKTRLLQAAWPLRRTASTFLGESESSKQTDLYGPVWVSKTDRVPRHPAMEARAK